MTHREAHQEPVERQRPDVVERTERRDALKRLPVEDEGVMRSAGMLCELGRAERGRSVPDDPVVGHRFVSQVRAQLLPLAPVGHVPEPYPSRTRSAMSCAAWSCRVGATWL